MKARGFWNNDGQDAFFDVRVFHPFAPTYQRSSLTSLYRQHQNQKRREYGFRVREVERGSFTPLVFTTNGGAAPEAATFLKRLASQISDKKNEPYSVVMNFLRCRLSFSLLRSSLLCLRGSRSNRSLNTACLSQDSLSLVASEGRLHWIITCSWHVPSLFVFFSERVSPPPPPLFFYLFDCFVNILKTTHLLNFQNTGIIFAWWCAFSCKFLFSFV